MDLVEERHLKVLALHETITVRSSVKGKIAVPRHRLGTYQNHFLGGSGQQDLRGERVELPRQLRVEKSPLELLRFILSAKSPRFEPEFVLSAKSPGFEPEFTLLAKSPGFVPEFALSAKSPGFVPEFTLSAKSPGFVPEFALSARSPGFVPEFVSRPDPQDLCPSSPSRPDPQDLCPSSSSRLNSQDLCSSSSSRPDPQDLCSSSASPTSPQTGGSTQDLIFSTLIGHLEKVFPGGGKNDMADVDLAATSSRPRTTGPPMWPTRHGEAGLTQTDARPYRVPTSSYVRSAWSDGVRNIPHFWAFQLDCNCGNPVSSVPPQSSTVPAGLVSDLLSLSWLAELGGP
ncbi:hypothetical protein GW17_00044134 [Ensete ventricosum]|nr:hypothetical protein GW17_00044134 [Ensete ventricosum]